MVREMDKKGMENERKTVNKMCVVRWSRVEQNRDE